MATGIVIVTVNTIGIGIAIVVRQSLFGRIVTTTETETTTVARSLSIAIDRHLRNTSGLPSGKAVVLCGCCGLEEGIT
jgi:hypothetical protein